MSLLYVIPVLLTHSLIDGSLDGSTAKVALDDDTVGAEQHNLGNTLNTVEFGGIVTVLRHINLRIGNILVHKSLFEFLLAIPYIYTKYNEFIAVILLAYG